MEKRTAVGCGRRSQRGFAVLSVLTVTQIRYWQTSYELYGHALAVVERNWLAHNNMAILLCPAVIV